MDAGRPRAQERQAVYRLPWVVRKTADGVVQHVNTILDRVLDRGDSKCGVAAKAEIARVTNLVGNDICVWRHAADLRKDVFPWSPYVSVISGNDTIPISLSLQ